CRCSCPDFSAHVTDGGLSCAGEGERSRTKIFNDCACTPLNGKDTGNFENNVFSGCPSVEFSGQLDPDEFRPFEFPWHSGHDVDGIGAPDSDCDHSQPTCIYGVGVGSNHHSSGEC